MSYVKSYFEAFFRILGIITALIAICHVIDGHPGYIYLCLSASIAALSGPIALAINKRESL